MRHSRRSTLARKVAKSIRSRVGRKMKTKIIQVKNDDEESLLQILKAVKGLWPPSANKLNANCGL